ncbi:hypothetical protein LXA43DRAFT_621085 [Ganoderma leucocontextum]|nr:hypothetical protein LXA43DRAFT_621085 [Ganoderma leucocontextum]
MTAETARGEIVLHPPDVHSPPIDLCLESFMGTWHVTHSTLPLWKSRKDVTITYTLKTPPSADGAVKFDDVVEYRSKSDPPSAARSRIVGVDTLITQSNSNAPPSSSAAGSRPPSGGGLNTSDASSSAAPATSSPSSGPPSDPDSAASTRKPAQTRYKWRGKGWLAVASSRWQLLGCSADASPGGTGAWAVTYFEKTLFTPAGLDIYARTADGLPADVVAEIIAKAQGLGGDVEKLAEGFFEVERSGVAGKGTV